MYFYDELGRLTRFGDYSDDGRSSHSVAYTYDANGNLSTRKETVGTETRTTTYTYDSSNRVYHTVTGDVKALFNYDKLSRVSMRQTHYQNSAVVYHTPTYYANSNQVEKLAVTKTGSNPVVTYTYTYDDNGNIRTVSDGTYTTRYSYDGANQLVREDNERAGKTWYWNYNTAGNLWVTTEYAYTTGALGDPISTVTNVYGSTVWRDLLTKHGDTTITYDTIGNTLNDGTWSYTWERGRQLKSMSNGTTTWNMTYDPDGLRTSRTDGTNTYYYYYTEGLLTYMKYNALVMRFTYDANGNPVSMTYNGNIYFYVLNLQGDVMALLDSSGNEVVSYHYNAWGKLLNTTASTTGMLYSLALYNPLRYRGYVYDRETELYYVSSRYYNPEICRFISADDLDYLGADGSPISYNLYAYCLNNPVNRFDATGNWSLSNLEKFVIGVTAIAVGVIVTAATGGAAVPVLVASLGIATSSAVVGAVSGAGISAVSHRISTGSWDGAGKAAVTGAIDGFFDGFMWGGITAGASFATAAAKGIRIQEIGKLNPSNKSGDGYFGVKYQAPKANGKYTTKSIELHSPHSSGPHNIWHWQQNTWTNYNNVSRITGNAKHWTIWGKRI